MTANLVRLTLTNDCTYDTNDVARGTTQAKGLPDIVVTDPVHLVEPRQIVFGPGNGHDYQDMYIANGSGTNVVVYDGVNGAYIKTISLPSGLGVTNWVGAVLADASYLYVLAGQKNQNKNCLLLKYNFGASSFTTPVINGNTNEFANVWYMQWAPDGKIIYSAMTPGWSYTVNEFDPKTGAYRRYFTPLGSATESQTFAFYFSPLPAIPKGMMILVM